MKWRNDKSRINLNIFKGYKLAKLSSETKLFTFIDYACTFERKFARSYHIIILMFQNVKVFHVPTS